MNMKDAAKLAKQALHNDKSVNELLQQDPHAFFYSVSSGPLVPTHLVRVELIHKGNQNVPANEICADVDNPRVTRFVAFCDVNTTSGECHVQLGPETIGGEVVDLEEAYQQHYSNMTSPR